MIIKKLLTIILTLIFLWTMFITTNPIKPNRLGTKYPICDVNISTWESVQNKADSITSNYKSPLNPTENFIRIVYKNLQDMPNIECKSNIPVDILYKAVTINITYEINQPVQLMLGIHRIGQGPLWGPVIVKPEDVNKPVTNTWLLDKTTEDLKFNWLSGAYEGASISLQKYDPSKPLVITIYSIYLE